MDPRGVRTAFLLGDWRDGDPSMKLEPKDAVVFMLEDDVPDRAGILVGGCEGGRSRRGCGMAWLVSAFRAEQRSCTS
jgi:hypothetical protein